MQVLGGILHYSSSSVFRFGGTQNDIGSLDGFYPLSLEVVSFKVLQLYLNRSNTKTLYTDFDTIRSALSSSSS